MYLLAVTHSQFLFPQKLFLFFLKIILHFWRRFNRKTGMLSSAFFNKYVCHELLKSAWTERTPALVSSVLSSKDLLVKKSPDRKISWSKEKRETILLLFWMRQPFRSILPLVVKTHFDVSLSDSQMRLETSKAFLNTVLPYSLSLFSPYSGKKDTFHCVVLFQHEKEICCAVRTESLGLKGWEIISFPLPSSSILLSFFTSHVSRETWEVSDVAPEVSIRLGFS